MNRLHLRTLAITAGLSLFCFSSLASVSWWNGLNLPQNLLSSAQLQKPHHKKKHPKKSPDTPPQTPPTAPPDDQKAAPDAPPPADGDSGDFGGPGPRPYDKVITKDAKSQEGLFAVHQVKDKIYWEIPDDMIGREFLWHMMLDQASAGSSDGIAPGLNLDSQVIKFEKHDDTLWLRKMDYSNRSEPGSGESKGVALTSVMPIIRTFPIDAYNKKNHTIVINVSSLYLSEPSGLASILVGSGVNPDSSVVLNVDDFPENIEANVQLTVMGGGGGGRNSGLPPGLAALLDSGPKTAVVHYSLNLLPAVPMTPRLADSRVGYFSEPFTMYGSSEHEVVTEAYIDRFKLVKKHPDQAISDPVQPIVYYISREVPDVWRPYIKKAVLAWEPVFEAAGFSNAIECKDAPSVKEDPKWSPEDARYSVIRWATTPNQNAEGQSIQDPRSGQTLSGKVVVWYNVLQLAQSWYFAQAAACDPAARRLPLSTETLGPLLTYILTHEVGHTLGLEHNFKASAQYPTESLRNAAFTDKYGDEASIMDYGRFNYVAQPGDNARLIPIIGPYDYFAIKYGYMPAVAPAPEQELPILDRFLAQDVTNKFYRFGNTNAADPEMQSEDLGDNPITATTYGLKNIDRISNYLLDGTVRYGRSFRLLGQAYGALVQQRLGELLNVMKLVGGVHEDDFHGGHVNNVFYPVSKAKQRDAVQFLMAKGLQFPSALLNPSVLNKIQSSGTIDAANASAGILINGLLNESRIKRMFDNEVQNGNSAYTVADMVAQMQSAIWNQLHQKNPTISLYQQNIQNLYLKALDDRLNGAAATETTLKGIAIVDLTRLRDTIGAKLPKVQDLGTKAHLLAAYDEIKKILKGDPIAQAGPGFDLASLLGGLSPDICGYGDIPNKIKEALGK